MSCGKDLVCDVCGNDDCAKFKEVGYNEQPEYQCDQCGNTITECQ
ncbi:hypothetical protein [Metallumcola ferriviriculae]